MDSTTATAPIVVGMGLGVVGLLLFDRTSHAILSIGVQALGVGVLAVTAAKMIAD